MGIHELRGYGRIFSAIGLKPELAEYFGTRNFLGSEKAGYGFLELERTLLEREGFLRAEKVMPAKDFRFNPRIYKAAQEVASGKAPYAHFQEKVRALERENPVAARQLLEVRFPERSDVAPEEVDLSVGAHSLPFVISAMSFGSQGRPPSAPTPKPPSASTCSASTGRAGRSPTCWASTPPGGASRWPRAASGSTPTC